MSRWVAALGCGAVIVIQTALMGRAVVGLDVGLVLAFALWATRSPAAVRNPESILRPYVFGLGVQVLHFVEELATGFPRAFPALFGYAWSDARFVAFNVAWLVVFVVAALGVRREVSVAYVVVWFFALVGGIGNGVLHVAMSVIRGAYFPGLVTAPVLFVVGVMLVRRLTVMR